MEKMEVRWSVGGSSAGEERLDTAPQRALFVLHRSGEKLLDPPGREYSADDLRNRIEFLGSEAPDYYRDALAALEGGRSKSGTGRWIGRW